MPKFRKKPVVIEAFRYGLHEAPDWFHNKMSAGVIYTNGTGCDIHTLEGVMHGEVGDYIIQGVKLEVYPCKPDIFEATYEPAEQHAAVNG